MNNTLDYLTALFFTLQKMRGRDFKHEDYKWKIGAKVLEEARLEPPFMMKKPTIFGIELEIDYENPNNVQIFEDITNKIYIEGADNDTSTKES